MRLPVRGIFLLAPRTQDAPQFERFIEKDLRREGVNTLILGVNYHYQFQSHPEVRERDSLSRYDLVRIAEACRKAGIRLIPSIDLLGHQSWHDVPRGLLRAHPDFDELSERFPCEQSGCNHSYCPLHPGVHKIVFDLVDELMDVTGADAFHAGLDEVTVLGESRCPRCRGHSKAQLFADEVNAIHAHLALSGRSMWMWGDRLIDGRRAGIGGWDGSKDGTSTALFSIPTDITICDWHYDSPVPSALWFAVGGFHVITCTWNNREVAQAQLALILAARRVTTPQMASRMMGMMQTVWSDPTDFIRAYHGIHTDDSKAVLSAKCFRILFSKLRRS